MILVDTSVWISFLRADDPDLSSILKTYLRKGHVFSLSAVFGELHSGARNQREKRPLTGLWSNLPKVKESDLFIQAGLILNEHKLHSKGVGLIDCYILAAAVDNDLALWTLDKKLLAAFDSIYKNIN